MRNIYQFIILLFKGAIFLLLPRSKSAETGSMTSRPPDVTNRDYVLSRHGKNLEELAKPVEYVVFLCGPSLNNGNECGASVFRKKIENALNDNGFEVFLGEDDGLEELRCEQKLNAQDNELSFIERQCDAIVIIPSSVGSFCELGLFSWHHTHNDGKILKAKKGTQDFKFIALIDKKYQGDNSYFAEGQIKALKGFGEVLYVDYNSCDMTNEVNDVKNILENVRRGRLGY